MHMTSVFVSNFVIFVPMGLSSSNWKSLLLPACDGIQTVRDMPTDAQLYW